MDENALQELKSALSDLIKRVAELEKSHEQRFGNLNAQMGKLYTGKLKWDDVTTGDTDDEARS